MVQYYVLTLFPELISSAASVSILGRAANQGLLQIIPVNIREYTRDKHKRVDDYPYGGGAGMVMQAEPIFNTMQALFSERKVLPRLLFPSPQGPLFTQQMADELSREEELCFLCGHYEGVDERVLELFPFEPVSIGDYVVTGGELPAMLMIDAIARMVPGVLHNQASWSQEESFRSGLLEYPQYSRPEVFEGKEVPPVLLSGHHARIAAWRREQSVLRTARNRPDLLAEADLSAAEQEMVKKYLQ